MESPIISPMPLRVASYLALAVVLVASLLILHYLIGWILAAEQMPLGFMTQLLLQLGSLAALSFLIAIQGLYINRIYNQVKERPLAIIEYRFQRTSPSHETLSSDEAIEVLWTGRTERDVFEDDPPPERSERSLAAQADQVMSSSRTNSAH